METKVACISIIVEKTCAVDALNNLLHEYADAIIGRMGIPHRQKGINIISLVVDASAEKINGLSDGLSGIDGVSANMVYSKN